jgi:hypothetical protein
MKCIVIDIVVADIPPKFGMILSRTWDKKVGISLQIHMRPSMFLEEKTEDYTENSGWHTL